MLLVAERNVAVPEGREAKTFVVIDYVEKEFLVQSKGLPRCY